MPKLTLCYHCNKFPLSKVNKKRTQLYKSWTTRSRRGTRKDFLWSRFRMGFPCGTAGREPACNVGDLGLIPGLGRSPGEGKGYPLQYSGHYTAHGVAESWTQLSLSSLFGTQGSVFFFATVLYCIHCHQVEVLFLGHMSQSISSVFSPNIQNGNFLSKTIFMRLPVQIFNQKFYNQLLKKRISLYPISKHIKL